MASVTKDFHRLLKRVGKLTDGQATIADIDRDEGLLQKFHVILQPNAGLYKNGKFKFEVTLTKDYPDSPPVVWCHTDIYHPNIDPTGECYGETLTNVCLNVLEHGVWSRSFGLEGAILGLLFLMHNPNLSDPLSPYFEGSDNDESFAENVKKYMAGEEFDDISFETDFCVKDGILITEQRTVTSEIKDESVNMAEGQVEDLKIVNDVISVTNTKSINSDERTADESKHFVLNSFVNGATNELQEETTRCSLSEQDIIKEKDSEFDKELDSKPNSETDKNTDGLDDLAADEKCNDDECSKCDIELVSIDGECVLLINSSIQETNSATETSTSDSASVDTNTKGGDNVGTQENTEIKTETGILCNDENIAKDDSCLDTIAVPFETNASCNTDNTAKVDLDLDATNVKTESKDSCITEASLKEDYEDSAINDMSPVLNPPLQLNCKQHYLDGDSLSNEVKCGCGTWYMIRSAFSKIVHTIGHNKLYRDIGI
ncbi:uncharacterized protein LOC123547753 [Mercenaria mercenaria]|uniref:uncharacterized protein LOC123547753 n=1 Tax=Mercenaria mercenaria TaxID=6596 RepID=UPI00234F59BC|nr:uncharacterized protein LOC123547753 [Mercenaria mercenaria]